MFSSTRASQDVSNDAPKRKRFKSSHSKKIQNESCQPIISTTKTIAQVSPAKSDLTKGTNIEEPSNAGENFPLKLDMNLVKAMKDIINEFESYVLVLETVPESQVIKEVLLYKLESREELFEENLMKFKLKETWLLTEAMEFLDNDIERYLRYKYKTYIETFEIKQAAMREKRIALSRGVSNNGNYRQLLSNERNVSPDKGMIENTYKDSPDDVLRLAQTDVVLVQNMKIIINEFNSYVFVLSTIAESQVIREALLRKLKSTEKLFEENFVKFKLQNQWMLNVGLKCYAKELQGYISDKYKDHTEILESEQAAMNNRIIALSNGGKLGESSCSLSNDQLDQPQDEWSSRSASPNSSETSVGPSEGGSSSDDIEPLNLSADAKEVEKTSCEEDANKTSIAGSKSINKRFVSSYQQPTIQDFDIEEEEELCYEGNTSRTYTADVDEIYSEEIQQSPTARLDSLPAIRPLSPMSDYAWTTPTHTDYNTEERGKASPDRNSTNARNGHSITSTQELVQSSMPDIDDFRLFNSCDEEAREDLIIKTEYNQTPPTIVNLEESTDGNIPQASTAEVVPEIGKDENCNDESKFKNCEVSSPIVYCCHICKLQFDSEKLYYSHNMTTHHQWPCNICNETFKMVIYLVDHVMKLHPSHHVCTTCFMVIETSAKYKHDERSHGKLYNKTQIKEKFKCRACSKVFNSKDEVKKHEMDKGTHSKDFYSCKHCVELFLTKYDLQKHVTKEHLVVKENTCKVCYLDFDNQSSLMRHLKAAHLMIKNVSAKWFFCICCYQRCETGIDLMNHMKFDHQNDRLVEQALQGDDNKLPKNKCLFCDLYLSNPKVRAIHIIVFHMHPPYECVCKRTFYTKAQLDEHVLKHTRVETERMKRKKKPVKKGGPSIFN